MKYSLQLVRSVVTSPNERWVNHTFIVGHHNNSVKFIIIRVDPTLWPLGLLLLLLFLTLFLIFYQHYCIFHVCTMAINIIRKTWTELRMLSHPNHLPPRLFLADDKRGKIAQEKPPSHKYVTIHRKPNLKWCSWCRKSDTRNSAVWCSRCSLAHLAPRSPPRVWHYTRRCCCCCSPAALALPDLQPRDEENCGAKCVFRAEIGARILIPPALPPPCPLPYPPYMWRNFPQSLAKNVDARAENHGSDLESSKLPPSWYANFLLLKFRRRSMDISQSEIISCINISRSIN